MAETTKLLPEVKEVIRYEPREIDTSQISVFENEEDEGAPWILNGVSEERAFVIGLSEEMKARVHEAVNAALFERQQDRSMFQ